MNRYSAILLCTLLLCASAWQRSRAQTPSWKHQIVFNSGPQFLIEDFANAYKTGLGIDVGYYYRVKDALLVGAFGGYHQFKREGGGADLDVIPVNLAVKYNFSLTGLQPYVGAEGGLFFLSESIGEGSTEIGLSPRIGLRVPLSRGIDLDLNVKYSMIFLFSIPSNFTYVGTNAGFSYIPDRANLEYR